MTETNHFSNVTSFSMMKLCFFPVIGETMVFFSCSDSRTVAHSGMFDGKLSHAQKIKCSRALKKTKKNHPNLTKLGYPLGIYLRTTNHARNVLNRTRGSGDKGVQRVRNDSAV